MAYAALVSLAELLEQIMHHHLSDEQMLESLHEKVSFLLAFLEDYSHKGGETFQSLEAQIRDTAYQAQDIIEYHISDCIQSKYDSRGVQRCFPQLLSATQKVKRRAIQNKHEDDLLKALEQIDSVVGNVMNIQMSCRGNEMQSSHASTLPSSGSAPKGLNKMVGFDKDLIGIKARLCGESSKLQIIPIVGMGGIGKTTLARNIFDDSLIAYHFHTRAWVTISQIYHSWEILLALVKSLNVITDDSRKMKNEELMEYVYKSLKGRTYLIILDDMWSREAWDDFKRIFPDDNNGSRIIITTRLTDIAEYASCSLIHQMHFLNEDQSWNLLREKVFAEQSCPLELQEIGMMIAKNCGGLPLAIAVVAGILTKVDRTQYHWKNIAKNICSAMANTDEHYSQILTLSYDHLPNYLKACFLYMGVFPEDYEIPVSKLIMLWVAEGFPKPFGSESLEEVAEMYLEDLIKRNLVLIISKKGLNGSVSSCGMHDLLRDLCLRKAQEEKFLDVYASGISVADQRRLTIHSQIYTDHLTENTLASPIRSVLHFGNDPRILSFVLCLRLLRVIHMPKTILDSFPVEITELFHLRYFDFAYYNSRGKLVMLLHNLQTIIIHALAAVTSPRSFKIWKIPQIRHLILKGNMFRIPSPPRIGGQFPVLETLQTLSGVVNFKFTRKAIGMIPNLKKLMVYCTYTNCAKRCLNNLVHLYQLQTLNLHFFKEIFRGRKRKLLCFPANCYALPVSLKKLTLRGTRPPSDNMAIIGSLPNLEVLKLEFFTFVDGYWESNEGEFQKMKCQTVNYSEIVCWRAESTHFPCLVHLVISYCRRLEEIPCAIGHITTLEVIEVGRCSKSAAASAVLILEEQRSLGNDILQVRIYEH